MARLLIISQSMALAMRLADQHEVSEHPPDHLEDLISDLDADVLVLDIGDAVLAVTVVNLLREAGKATPVLLVAGYQPEWEQVEAQHVEGVFVVSLPITRKALLTGISELTSRVRIPPAALAAAADPTRDVASAAAAATDQPRDEQTESEQTESEQTETEQTETEQTEQTETETETEQTETETEQTETETEQTETETEQTETEQTEAEAHQVQAETQADVESEAPSWVDRPASGLRGRLRPSSVPATGQIGAVADPRQGNSAAKWMSSRLGSRPRKMLRSQGYAPAGSDFGGYTDPFGLPVDHAGIGASDLDQRLDAQALAVAAHRPAAADGGTVLRTSDLVSLLHERIGDLYGVADTAQVLADDVIERADADAAAVLVPDGPRWRVSAGVGLRPLERRLILAETHWLIAEIGAAGRAVLIEDTDIVRQQLAGAPLAAWRHLLAVPVPQVGAIVVLARGQEGGPFTDRHLAAVIAPIREAASLLVQAVQVRRLARALDPLREQSAEPSEPLPAQVNGR